MVAGSSKFLTTILLNPLNILKTRIEIVGNNEYNTIFKGMK